MYTETFLYFLQEQLVLINSYIHSSSINQLRVERVGNFLQLCGSPLHKCNNWSSGWVQLKAEVQTYTNAVVIDTIDIQLDFI